MISALKCHIVNDCKNRDTSRTTKKMPQLKIITSDTERVLELFKDFYLLGRSDDSDIVIADAFISRHHLTLFKTSRSDYYRVADGNIETGILSRNGVRVNGAIVPPIASIPLSHGDEILLSPSVILTYLSQEDDYEGDTASCEFAAAI